MSEPLVSIRNVHKTYQLGRRPLEVLRGVDFEIPRGEFVALRGASGAGKSTLLHLLGGLDSPTIGEVWLNGRNLALMSRRELTDIRRLEVGFIFQAYYLLPELDALENVCLPGRICRASAAKVEARGRELLKRVGLGDRMEHKPYELSGGEQQRVAVARALINEPPLILADEPTGNLDSHTGSEILDLLLSIQAESNTTLIMATHDTKMAARAARTIQLVDGLIAATYPGAQPATLADTKIS
jgi:ABC-type lipoprotein export system ATPase subunit